MSWTCINSARGGALGLVGLVVLGLGAGCGQVRGRKLIQDANDLYKHGRYAEAVAVFEEAEALVPDLPTLWLNKGYTCRQLIVPGAHDPESQRAVACALAAFKRLAALQPGDARADQLTIETMFDADDLSGLEAIFLERTRRAPEDVDVVRGLQQVYYKWGKWGQALTWSKRAAQLRPSDAEAQYGVGTFIWQVLSSKGGGPEMAAYDPRPRLPPEAQIPTGASNVKKGVTSTLPVPVAPPAPLIAANDITGATRVELADEGIRYLQEAVRLRPRYPEALTYLALLCRQKSFAYFADVPQWQAAVDRSNEWQKRANEARTGKS
ncbi:MAG TPA: tetratricopeptide repeat protein [Polyangia bacterium]|jgi:tetratricopeptide (TPR) repeat protein|nr:tetratricopeptide repeat protein [Polyangia bacterium]